MSINVDKIKSLLGQGLPNETVASAVGCSPSYITQLMADPKFADEVNEIKISRLSDKTAIDDTAEKIEAKLLTIIEEAVDNNMILKPRDALAAYRIINGAKRRGAGQDLVGAQRGGHVVNLVMPVQVFHQLTVASNGEVIGVNGKSTATISPGKLLSNLRAEAENEIHRSTYARIAGSIPGESDRGSD